MTRHGAESRHAALVDASSYAFQVLGRRTDDQRVKPLTTGGLKVPRQFEPRSFLYAPKWFGISADATWKPWNEDQEPQVALAFLQHRMALIVSRMIEEGHRKRIDVADSLGISDGQLRHKLKGEVPFTALDVVRWPLVLGIDFLPELQSRSDLLPGAPVVGTN
jgi:hypothetical protein